MNINEMMDKVKTMKTECDEIISEERECAEIIELNQNKLIKCKNKKGKLFEEIGKLQYMIDRETMFETVAGIEGFNILSQQELTVIASKIYRKDFRTSLNPDIPRWLDLEKVVRNVILFKNNHPGWTLDSLTNTTDFTTLNLRGTYPPKFHYAYKYSSLNEEYCFLIHDH